MIDFGFLYQKESRRVHATLLRLLGDFDLAEEALHDAFLAATEQWPRHGVPDNPRAWLVSAGRFAALATLRRRTRFNLLEAELVQRLEAQSALLDAPSSLDDRLRLLFTCCHPALAADAQIAVTLREVCGLTTEQIASAFLVKPATIAQRIVRTKRKIRDERIPYDVPTPAELSDRLKFVLHVVYLLFNEGFSATNGAELVRSELTTRAIELARLLAELLPEPDVLGLLALLLLQDARSAARVSASGDIVLLSEQDRSRWDRAQIEEGLASLRRALERPPLGAYTLQAAIAAQHAQATSAASTNWSAIVELYDLLLIADPSPVVELNRAVALSECEGPAAGLARIDELLARSLLQDYRFAHAARADLLRRLGNKAEAARAYRRALELTAQGAEQRFLSGRLDEVET